MDQLCSAIAKPPLQISPHSFLHQKPKKLPTYSYSSSIQGRSPNVLENKTQFLQSNHFPKLTNRQHPFPALARTHRSAVYAQKQSWEIGRFVKTLFFFNAPPSPAKIVEAVLGKIWSSTSTAEMAKPVQASDVVLVVGATGGVGRRVVDILRKKGSAVRVLVRNKDKATTMLGSDVDMIIGDITKPSTLDPQNFKGVRKVINAASVIVGPKEGDTPSLEF